MCLTFNSEYNLETIFTGSTFAAALFIGLMQNQINKQALDISNFAEIFCIPSEPPQNIIIGEQGAININTIGNWKILIKNASSYPIYINDYTLNGVKHIIGSSALPNNPDSWYGVVIPANVQEQGEFSLLVTFEDYLGNKYQSENFGRFNNGWELRSQKRIALRK